MKNRAATAGKPKNKHHNPKMGHAFVHTVIDDHSRVAYAEIHDNETAVTATDVLRRAVAWFAAHGITTRRVLSDNGSAYVSHLWRDVCAELGIKHSRTRPRRPQTNGKIERFHRTMADGWGYARCYTSEPERRQALPAWLHEYNHHRPHTACGNKPPITRLINLSGQYSQAACAVAALPYYHRPMTMKAPTDALPALAPVPDEPAALAAAACLFHGFSDRSRLSIVQHLALGEHRVVDLTRHLGLAQSTVSKHLACLLDCGIVTVRAQGRASVYSLAHPQATLDLLAAAERLLAATGDAVVLCPRYGTEATS